jgi:hypothetical protein
MASQFVHNRPVTSPSFAAEAAQKMKGGLKAQFPSVKAHRSKRRLLVVMGATDDGQVFGNPHVNLAGDFADRLQSVAGKENRRRPGGRRRLCMTAPGG